MWHFPILPRNNAVHPTIFQRKLVHLTHRGKEVKNPRAWIKLRLFFTLPFQFLSLKSWDSSRGDWKKQNVLPPSQTHKNHPKSELTLSKRAKSSTSLLPRTRRGREGPGASENTTKAPPKKRPNPRQLLELFSTRTPVETIQGKESLQVSAPGTAEERTTKRQTASWQGLFVYHLGFAWEHLSISQQPSSLTKGPSHPSSTKSSLGPPGLSSLQASCCLSFQILHSRGKLTALTQDQSENGLLAQHWELHTGFGVKLPSVPKGDLLERLHMASTSLKQEIITCCFLLPLQDNTTKSRWDMWFHLHLCIRRLKIPQTLTSCLLVRGIQNISPLSKIKSTKTKQHNNKKKP